jgi:hypothetical protein
MNYKEIVMKLIGSIEPIGETNTDNARMDNLKNLCELVDGLVYEIAEVENLNKASYQHSVKAMADYAGNFLSKNLGIKE